LLVVGAGVWAFWLDPDRSVIGSGEMPMMMPAAAE
jgi:hypothetical protein